MRTPTASDIRTWAHEQGITVAERGRLSQDVLAADVKAHNGSVGADKTQSATAKSKPTSTRRTTAVKAATFSKALRKDQYVDSVKAHFLGMKSYRAFPTDEDFLQELKASDAYHFKRRG